MASSDLMDMVKGLMNEAAFVRWTDRNDKRDPTSLALRQQDMAARQLNEDRMLKKKMFDDNLTAQRHANELANPMSNLSASERYMNTMQNISTANKMNEVNLNKALGENTKAGMENRLIQETLPTRIATTNEGMLNAQYGQELANTKTEAGIGQDRMVSNYMQQPGKLDMLMLPPALASNLYNQQLAQSAPPETQQTTPQVTPQSIAAPITQPTAQKPYSSPYTDAYFNYSNSPAGLPLRPINAYMQNIALPTIDYTTKGLKKASQWTTTSRY